MTSYGSHGFQAVLTNDSDTLAAAMAYLDGEGLTQFVNYEAGSELDGVWGQYGWTGPSPHNILIDCDGNVRMMAVGAIDGDSRAPAWRKAIAECTGQPAP